MVETTKSKLLPGRCVSVNYYPFDEVISVLSVNYHPSNGVISVLSVNYHPSGRVTSIKLQLYIPSTENNFPLVAFAPAEVTQYAAANFNLSSLSENILIKFYDIC